MRNNLFFFNLIFILIAVFLWIIFYLYNYKEKKPRKKPSHPPPPQQADVHASEGYQVKPNAPPFKKPPEPPAPKPKEQIKPAGPKPKTLPMKVPSKKTKLKSHLYHPPPKVLKHKS